MSEDPGGGVRTFGSRFEPLSGGDSTEFTEVTSPKNKPGKSGKRKDTVPNQNLYTKQIRMDQYNGPRFLILKRTDPGKTMELENPFFIKKAMDAITTNVQISRLKDGDLLLKTVDRQQAAKLLKQEKFGGTMNIKITEHPKLNLCSGTIFCRDLIKVSDELILSELKDQKVVKVDRMKKKLDNGQLIDTGVFILTFDLCHIPDSIDVGFYPCKVKQYIPSPLRCMNCLKYGHTKNRCTGPRTCANCGTPYHDNAPCPKPNSCLHCQGQHSALDRKCPRYLDEMEIQKISVTERLSLNDARKKRRQQVPEVPVFTSSFAQVARGLRTATDPSRNLQSAVAPNQPRTPQPAKPTNTKNDNKSSPTPTGPNNRGQLSPMNELNNADQQPSCSTTTNDVNALFVSQTSTPPDFMMHTQTIEGTLQPQQLLALSQTPHNLMDCDQQIDTDTNTINNTNTNTNTNSAESNNLLTISQAITNSINILEQVSEEEF